MRTALAAALTLVLPVAAAAAPHDPFTVPAAQVTSRIRSVAICPPRNSSPHELPTPVTGRHATKLASEFERANVRVVGLGICARAWIEAAALLGGIYDPITGKPDPAKWKLAREHTLRELTREHQIDGVVDWGYYEAPVFDLSDAGPWWTVAGEPLSIGAKKLRVYELGIGANRVVGLWAWLAVSDRSDATLYRETATIAWSELRLGARTERRGVPALTSPERDAGIKNLLEHFVRAYRNADMPAAREAAAAYTEEPK